MNAFAFAIEHEALTLTHSLHFFFVFTITLLTFSLILFTRRDKLDGAGTPQAGCA